MLFISSSTGLDAEDAQGLAITGFVFCAIAAVLLIVLIVIAIVKMKGRRRIKYLMEDGICYEAEIIDVYLNYTLQVNHVHPFVIECGFVDRGGRSYLVKSKNIWGQRFRDSRDSVKARVYVNRDDPEDYYVDVYFAEDRSTKYENDFR